MKVTHSEKFIWFFLVTGSWVI